MRKLFFCACACVALALPALVAGATPPGGTLVTVGSPATSFSHNKQNEPSVAIDPANPSMVAAGSNDEIDDEDCNAGDPTTCPFTQGVGVSGIYLSSNGGASWTQPTYQGWTARQCIGPPGYTCTPGVGPIGTLPRYYENGLVSDGDPALVFGPRRGSNGRFSWAAGSRLYYSNLTSNFSNQRSEQTFSGFEAVAVSRSDNYGASWKDPVIVSKQNAALFSDKEQLWADNAESTSPYFGNVYLCNASFRGQEKSPNAAPAPILFVRSTNGGDTWGNPKQLSSATNNVKTSGRQDCAIRTDSRGTVYVYWDGAIGNTGQPAIFQTRSFDGGATFERPRAIATYTACGLFDPNTGRLSFDGVAGARTSSLPSVDIANGAPSGTGATDEIVMSVCDGPTPSATNPAPNERAAIWVSTDHGQTFTREGSASPPSDRPDFPAIAITPNGSNVYLTYDNFLQQWQSTTANPRWMQGVVRHAPITAGGAPGAWSDLDRAPVGDARGSTENGLTAEFLGDYNYAYATNSSVVAVWNDVRNAADCPAIDAYRQGLVSGTAASPPAPNVECPPTFGNSDIFGGSYPTP